LYLSKYLIDSHDSLFQIQADIGLTDHTSDTINHAPDSSEY